MWEFRTPERPGVAITALAHDEYYEGDPIPPDGSKVKLSNFFGQGRVGATCLYLYDFGDGWEVDVACVGVVDLPETFRRRLLLGERAGPKEDCGGVGGFERILDLKAGPLVPEDDEDREEIDSLMVWLGTYDPAVFDIEECRIKFDR